MTRMLHPSGWKHIDGYCPATVPNHPSWHCNRTVVRDGMCKIHADAADRAKTREPNPTYSQLRAERDALREHVAAAWDEGSDFVTRHPGMSAEYVRWANPYRKPEGNRA